MVDGRFFGHFFWQVEGSSVHTCESRAAHMCHVQLTCGKLLYGGGEPSCVAHVCHVWQLTWTLLLYGGGEPSHVAHMWSRLAINVHITTIWWRGPSHVAHVHGIHMQGSNYLYGGGEPSHVDLDQAGD